MHFFVEIVFDEVHARSDQEAALIVHRQMTEGGLTTKRIVSEDRVDTEVNVQDGTLAAEDG